MAKYKTSIKAINESKFDCSITEGYDVIKTFEARSDIEAAIWVDNELSILETGYGIWGNIHSDTIDNEEGDTHEDDC